MKKYILGFLGSILFLEISTRIILFIITLNHLVFFYGFDKTFIFKIVDFSKLKFAIYSNNNYTFVNPKNYITKNNQIIIWTFGGSTTEGYEPNCGHSTSSWPSQLEILDKAITVKNFAKKGSNSNFAIKQLFKNLKNAEMPNIILWANKVNEESNTETIDSNNLIFLKTVVKTLESNLIFFKLYNEFIHKVKIHVFKIDNSNKFLEKDNQRLYEEALKNYNSNTELAISLSNSNNIKFYIVSLFTKFDFGTKKFYERDFYKLWESNAKEISKKNNVNFLDTKKILLKNFDSLDKNTKYFCEKDFVHQTFKGNQLTAEIIYNYIFGN